jgi:hypothetical protein
MLTLRDFLAAKSAIAKNFVSKVAALPALSELDQRPAPASWLKALMDQGILSEENARLIHSEVEKFEYLRAEAFYVQAALELGIDPSQIENARTQSRETGYQKRSGNFLLESQVITNEAHQEIIAGAKAKYIGDGEQRLESFRKTLITSSNSAIQVPSATAMVMRQQVVDPDDVETGSLPANKPMMIDRGGTDLTSTLSISSNLSGELLPQALGNTIIMPDEPVHPGLSAPGAPTTPPPPGSFSFSADQLRSGGICLPTALPAPMVEPEHDADATRNQMPPNMVAKLRAEAAASAIGLSKEMTKLIGDDMLAAAISSRYDVERLLGQGQMGKVFLATSKELGHKVALKLTQPKGRNADEVIARFKREILVTALIFHPNVVEVYDKDELPDGSFYMAMEVLDGIELKDYLKERGKLEIGKALDITQQLTEALKACHEAEVVHRDVKPENITILEKDDGSVEIKLVDFGLARLLTQEDVVQAHVFTSLATQVSGSPHYMAPESITNAETIDFRCDLYALGVTLFELVTGKRPFNGRNNTEILDHQLNSSVPLLEDMLGPDNFPRSLETLIRKLMEKDRELRFQDCDSVLLAIAEVRKELTKPKKKRQDPKRKSILRSFIDLFKRMPKEE